MCKIILVYALVAASLLECSEAHGVHHPVSRDEDRSFDNLVEQKYPTLSSLGPSFVAEYRRNLAVDLTHNSENASAICDPQCVKAKETGQWLSCDDLIPLPSATPGIVHTCTYSDTYLCPGKCANCQCSCEKTCRNGKSCDELIAEDKTLNCEILTAQGCNCRGCACSCTQKCSMRDSTIKGSYDCGEWYRMDPKYTEAFLRENALVTGTNGQPTSEACACEGCSGTKAIDYCPQDHPAVTSDYMDIDTAKANGVIEKMRLAINDDMLDPDKCRKNDFCRKHTCLEGDIGKVIDICEFEKGVKNGDARWSASKCQATCKAEDILTKEKSFMVRRRFDWLKTFMADLLSLKPTLTAIKLDPKNVKFIEALRDPETGKIQEYDNTDLVVVVTMRPSVSASVSGYAIALQRDHERRATVGLFNWCPNTVKQELYKIEVEEEKLTVRQKADLLYSKAADYRLMVHEVLHLTGAIKSDPYNFINKYGEKPCSHQIYVDEVEEWSGHRVRKLRTPKLLALAREQFGCSSLTGVPIEDHPVGYGSHWEARVFGSEIMSYGENSGESYLSDLTLAYLEDTGYYVANYSNAGRLTPHSAEKVNFAEVFTFLTKNTDELRKKAGEPGELGVKTSPGYTRWGRHEGCDFVTGAPKNWPTAYKCSNPDTGGCTPDHKMSARCTLETWGVTKHTGSLLRCEPPENEKWGNKLSSNVKWTCKQNPAGFSIPTEYHHLGAENTLAGYNDAMDFVPHMVGFWNCQDLRPNKLSPLDLSSEAGASQNTSVSWDELFGTLSSDSRDIKGQTQCENCRCFRSSLVPLTDLSKFQPDFPTYGLCYVSNCYSEEYLQVGIVGSRGLYWYGCHPEGGKMFIPLFTGSLRCPVAKEFCSFEPITGKIFTETDPVLENVFYGVIVLVVLIALILLCVFWKKIDQKVHFCCGMDPEHKDWEQVLENRHGKHSPSGYILTVLGAIWAIAGLALIAFGIYSFLVPFIKEIKPLWATQVQQAPTFLVIGLITLGVSICGIEGAWKDKPTITLVIYFYTCVVALIFFLIVPILPFILSDPIRLILESQWASHKDNFDETWQQMNSTAAIDRFIKESLPQYGVYFGVAAAVFIISVIAGIVCSILQLTLHVLVRNFEVVMNILFFIIGAYLIYFSSTNFLKLDVPVYVCAVLPASVLFIVGVFGIGAACQKHETCFRIWFFFALFGFITALVTASILVYVSMPPPENLASAGHTPVSCFDGGDVVTCDQSNPMCCSCDRINVDIVVNASRRSLQSDSFTRCMPSCFAVYGYSCTEVGSDTTTTTAQIEKSLLMKIDPYIRSLDDDKRAEITNAVSQSVDLVDFNMEQLIAWTTAYLRIYAVVLFTCCLVICALFVTNRLIIRWNQEHDHPHGQQPYYLMLAVSQKKKNLRNKLKVIKRFKSNLKFLKANNDDYRKIPLMRSLTRGAKRMSSLIRRVQTRSVLPLEDRYPEVVQLRVVLDAPSTDLGVEIEVFENDGGTRLVASEVYEGPLYRSGLMENDVFLTVDNLNIHKPEHLYSAIQGKTDIEFVVKRMARSRGQGRRENKIHTFHITISDQLGLGLNLKMITSDFVSEEANTFLYVSELREYPNGDPGPGLVAGVRQYDLLLKMNDQEIHSVADVRRVIEGEETVQCQVRRMIHHFKPYDEKESSDEIVVVQRLPGESLGLSISESYDHDSVDPFLIVTKVRDGGAGFRAGIEARDIIVKINGKAVNDLDDLKAMIAGATKIELTVRRPSA